MVVTKYQWYEIVDGADDLRQGDFIQECPIATPPPDTGAAADASAVVDVEVSEYDVVVMSQSCDLAHGNVGLVLVCPRLSWTDFQRKQPSYRKDKHLREGLRRGNMPGLYVLNRCDIAGFKDDYQVVEFRNVYSVDFNLLKQVAEAGGRRLRLCPPYREALSQAFARFFMRVGLPVELPSLPVDSR